MSNHAPKKQVIYDIIKLIFFKAYNFSRSKSRGYPNSHIVNWTIIMTDKVFSQPVWIEVHTDCIEVRYVEACKKTCAKVVRHRVIQNQRLAQQLHVGVEVVDDCQPSNCTSILILLNIHPRILIFNPYIIFTKLEQPTNLYCKLVNLSTLLVMGLSTFDGRNIVWNSLVNFYVKWI